MKTYEAINLVLALLARAQSVSARLAAARLEGREDLTDEEVDEIAAETSDARQELDEAIQRARARESGQ